jgi:hypothetical protein
LDELFDGSEGKTVTLDGHEYTIKEIKPFKHVPGIDTVVLEPKDKNSEWYRETRQQLRDDWYQDVSDPRAPGRAGHPASAARSCAVRREEPAAAIISSRQLG